MAWENSQLRECSFTIASADIPAGVRSTDQVVRINAAALPAEVLDSDDSNAPQANGGDIRFGDASGGGTMSPFDLARYDPTSGGTGAKADIYVKVSIPASGDATFWMGWSTAGTTTAPAATDTNGRNATYPSGYEVFYHLGEASNTTSGGYVDSTGNNDGTANEAPGTRVDDSGTGDWDGYATVFGNDGSSDLIHIATDSTVAHGIGTGDFAMGAWVRRVSDTGQNFQGFMTIGSFSPGSYVKTASENFGAFDGSVKNFDTEITTGGWRLLTIARRSGTLYGYINGTEESTTPSHSDNIPNAVVAFGSTSTTLAARHSDVEMANAFIFDGTWTADYETFQHDSQSDPGAFLTTGPAQASGGGQTVAVGGASETDSAGAVTGSTGSGTITLTDFEGGFVVQRDVSAGTRDVIISGAYTGTPTAIQYRIVNDGTETAISGHDWQTLDASPSGNTFSGTATAVPAGGWYNVDVRFSNDTGTTDGGTSLWGVGARIGVIGQSNGVRMFTVGDSPGVTANSLLRKRNQSGWSTIGSAANGAKALGNKLITDYISGIPVALYDYAEGGTAMGSEADAGNGYWADDTASEVYDDFLQAVLADGGELEAVCINQGGREAIFGSVTEAEYETDWNTFRANLRSDITNLSDQTNLPIIVGRIARGTSGGTAASWQGIREAHRDVAEDNADCYWTDNYDHVMADSGHFTGAGYADQGERWAHVLGYIWGDETYWEPPKATSWQRSGTTVTVTITHSGGTDFTPTTGIEGFEFTDDGTPITINAAVRTDATTITLTLASTPSGVEALRYAYGNNPTSDSSPLPAFSHVVDNSSIGLPLASTESIPEATVVVVGGATETDSAGSVDALNGLVVAVGGASETDTAGAVSPVGGAISVGVTGASETDSAGAAAAVQPFDQTIGVGGSTETDSAGEVTVTVPVLIPTGRSKSRRGTFTSGAR